MQARTVVGEEEAGCENAVAAKEIVSLGSRAVEELEREDAVDVDAAAVEVTAVEEAVNESTEVGDFYMDIAGAVVGEKSI